MAGLCRSAWTTGLTVTIVALVAACGSEAEEPRPKAAYSPAASSETAPPPASVPAPPPVAAPAFSNEPAAAPPPASVPPTPMVEPQPTGGDPAAPASGGTSNSVSPQAPAVAPFAVEQHAKSGIEIALMEVKRTGGDTVTVRWQYRNTGTSGQNVDELWSGYVIANGAYLIDSGNKKKYLVIRDAENTPVASNHSDRHIPAGKSTSSWARVPAPPADVAKITVVIPNAPPFEDVPIK